MKALVLAVAIAAIPTVQGNTAASVWTAEFNGKTFAKVELHVSGTTVHPTASRPDISQPTPRVSGLHS